MSTTEPSPSSSVAGLPLDVQVCVDSVWSAGIVDAGVDPWSSWSGDGQTTTCVIVDEAGEDWRVEVTFDGSAWTNGRMGERFDAEWFPVVQRVEYSDTDGEWYEQQSGYCVDQNGQSVCTPANPAAEIARAIFVCDGRLFTVRPYTAEGAESQGRPTSDQYRAIQTELFSKICSAYPAE